MQLRGGERDQAVEPAGQKGLTFDGNAGHSKLKQQELSRLELVLCDSMPAHALCESHLPWQLMLDRGQANNRHKLTPLQIMDM